MGYQRQPMSDEVRARLQRIIAEDRGDEFVGTVDDTDTADVSDHRDRLGPPLPTHRRWDGDTDDRDADGPVPVNEGRRFLPGRRLPFERRHLPVIAVVLVIGLLLTGYWLIRSREVAAVEVPGPVASPVAESSPTGDSPTGSNSSPNPGDPASGDRPSNNPEATQQVYVHVLGAVARPGVVQVVTGSRVGDAIVAAGGFTPDARPGELNLAAPVPDGAQIWVGDTADPGGELRPSGSGAPEGSVPSEEDGGGLVNLNTASATQLEELPGVGPVTATNIINWRDTNGGFRSVEQLQDVDGIGAKTYERLAPLVTV